jgi:hypothetical protein
MSAAEPPEPLPSEIEELRTRATRCRDYAKEYATDVGTSLSELAVELDHRADRLEAAEDDEIAPMPVQSSAGLAQSTGK